MPNPQHFKATPGEVAASASVRVDKADPAKSWVLVEMPTGDGEWLALYRVVSHEGTPSICATLVVPMPATREERERLREQLAAIDVKPRAGISASALRGLRAGIAQDLALKAIQAALTPEQMRAFHGIDPDRLAAGRRRGRYSNTDDFYATMAAAYVKALPGKAPVARVADELGFSRDYVRDVMHKARVRGFLTKAPPGQAGGELTEKALSVLREHDQEENA